MLYAELDRKVLPVALRGLNRSRGRGGQYSAVM